MADFGALSPKEFDALVERHNFEQKRADFRSAIVASTIANVFRARETDVFRPQDFMPGERRRQTPQQQYDILKALTLALGGDVDS